MDPAYAKAIGVDVDELLLSQPDHGEQALEIADLLVRSAALDVVAIDSVAALVPKAEIEGEMGDTHVGLQARLMSQALRKLAGNLNRAGTICIFTNQLREKIGVMFGSPETTPGGRALKFYASVRLDIRRIETLKEGTEAVGNRARVKVVKNKVAPPFRQAEFDIIYGEGISHEGNLIDLGVERGMVQKSGAYFSFGDERLGQGRHAARTFLKEHSDIADQLEARIREDAGVPNPNPCLRPGDGRGHRAAGAGEDGDPEGREARGQEVRARPGGGQGLSVRLAGPGRSPDPRDGLRDERDAPAGLWHGDPRRGCGRWDAWWSPSSCRSTE